MKYKDILDTFGGDTSYADRAQAALLKWDTAAFSNVAKEYRASQQWQNSEIQQQPQQPAPSTVNTQWNNVWNWNYWADTADRQDEIVSNLNAAYEQNPNQFSDWNTFAQNFNYDYVWRSDKERETMWNWYNTKVGGVQWQQWQQMQIAQPQTDGNNVGNTDYFFNQLLSWNPLQWEWAAITAAQNRYNNLKYLSSMTPDQLSSAIASWNLNPVWQDMQDLKNYAPALYAQVQTQMQQKTQLDDINTLWDWIYNWLTKTETNWNYTNYDMSPTEYAKNASVIKQYNESLYKKIEWLGWDTAAYVAIVASMLQNPMIQASKNEVEDLEWEIRKIQENIYTIWDTSRSVLWSEAPEDLVSAYISHQTKQLQNQLRTAQNSLLVAQGKLNNQLTEVETMIDAINNGVKLYWEGWTSWSNYQYVSWSKYQDAGYFDKSTGQFYKLWEQPDTRDYQTDDPARLQEIRDNLAAIADSDDAYVFRDRNAFNDYFKYSQRWAAQRAVLDEFWNANAARLKTIADQKYKEYQKRQAASSRWTWWSGWGSWSGWWTTYSAAANNLKNAIISWSFWWNLTTWPKKYWYKETTSPETVIWQVWRECKNKDEFAKVYAACAKFENTSSETWTTFSVDNLRKQLAAWYFEWYVSRNADTIKSRLDSYSSTSDKKEYLNSVLSEMWLKQTKTNREAIAKKVWAEY